MLANSCKELCNLVSILIYIVWLDVQNILEKYYHLSWHCYYDCFLFFCFLSSCFTGKETSSKKLSALSKATWSGSGGDGI